MLVPFVRNTEAVSGESRRAPCPWVNLAVTVLLPDRPTLTSPTAASATVGVQFTYQITATNAPTHYFVTSPAAKGTTPPASSLPADLTYDTATGLLSGAPTRPLERTRSRSPP